MKAEANGVSAKPQSGMRVIDGAVTGLALGYLLYLLYYYNTGIGGPTLLAVQMVPASIAVLTWNDLLKGSFHPRLQTPVRFGLALFYTIGSAAAAFYLYTSFDAIRIQRLGDWNPWDHIAGGFLVLLVLEHTRRHYFPVFVFNLLLILYCVYGFLVPGMFQHPGLSWNRVSSSLALEMSTGIFERLPQLALTLIGSFILLLATLKAFGCIDSILKLGTRIAQRSPNLLPQGAIIGSFGVAAVSGSGAANAAATGSATIPMLIKAGFPRSHAAAVETAASLGGQLMPPLMGISAFLMADMMGVSYMDVVSRGFGPAFIYFFGIALAVYLLSRRYVTGTPVADPTSLTTRDKIQLLSYLGAIACLVWLMGFQHLPAMLAAQYVFYGLFALLSILHLLETWRNPPATAAQWWAPARAFVRQFSVTTSELTLLLAALGILTAAFSITGIPDKLGILLMQLAEFHLLAMVLTAFALGYVVGMGLPVAPTYLVLSVVSVPFLIRAGIDPWSAHFFAFLVAIFGELSPPTSVTAAVTSRIAGAPFVRTVFSAVTICLPLLILMVAVFTRPQLILDTGSSRWLAFALVLTATLAIALSVFGGKLWRGRRSRLCLRGFLIAASVAILLVPDPLWAGITAIPTALITVYLLRPRGGLTI